MKMLTTDLIMQYSKIDNDSFEIVRGTELIMYFYSKRMPTLDLIMEKGWHWHTEESIVIYRGKSFNNKSTAFNIDAQEIKDSIKEMKEDKFKIVILLEFALFIGSCEIVQEIKTADASQVTRRIIPHQAVENKPKRG